MWLARLRPVSTQHDFVRSDDSIRSNVASDAGITAMPEIALILFDLNGVLYRYERDTRIAYLGALANQSSDAIRRAIWDSGFEDAGDAGALDAGGYLRGFGERMRYDLSEDEWLAAQLAAVEPIAASLELLPRLRPRVDTAVLTNNNLLVRRHFDTLYPGLAALVGERAYVSAQLGARKPEPDAYVRCLSRLGVAPATTLFVDDSPTNVAGARRAGLLGYEYSGPDELGAELRRRELLK